MIHKPYLLFLADASDRNACKTAYGVAYWRPNDCVGELRYPQAKTDCGTRALSIRDAAARGAKTLLIGLAPSGGSLAPAWVETILQALDAGLDIASGMHVRLDSVPAIRDRAQKLGRALHDVRVPPPGIRVGSGRPRTGKRLLTVGTDCSVGKMFTSLALEKEMRARGIKATFRATGQTGILIAGSGIAVDAVIADFISGASEQLSPANEGDHWDLVEGQGSLFHPSFAGVSLGLLHGAQPHLMVMCHDPSRRTMRGDVDHALPGLRECIALNEQLAKLTNPRAKVIGLSLNTVKLADGEARNLLAKLAQEHGMPAVDPVRTGVAPLVDAIVASRA
ncbi:MAG: N-acetyltransferase DgcN [Planctomycetota bacterium]